MRFGSLGAALVLVATNAGAVAIAPCTDAGTMDIIPLTNGAATYCVSDYGWSDAWFIGRAPAVYDPRFDVLSGDDAPNLHFGIKGGAPPAAVSGFGWISPLMDGGLLMPAFPTFSPWEVVTSVHLIAGTTTAQSLVHHPAGIDLLITTSLAAAGQEITQRFRITNVDPLVTFDRIRFADYFNFHPNGSDPGNAGKGTVSYTDLGGIRITGIDDGTLIANGSMRGERVADARGHSIVGQFIPLPVLDMVATDTYDFLPPGALPPWGPADVAGGLAWDLGELAPGEFTEFTIFKLAEPLRPAAAPAPSTVLVLFGGLIALAGLRGGAVWQTGIRRPGRLAS